MLRPDRPEARIVPLPGCRVACRSPGFAAGRAGRSTGSAGQAARIGVDFLGEPGVLPGKAHQERKRDSAMAKKPTKEPKKKLGAAKKGAKKGGAKPSRLKSAKKKPAREKKIKPRKAVAAPRGKSGGERIAFICSECYEDFVLTGSEVQDSITCPECLHVGKKPDDDFLRTVRMHKQGERSSLVVAAVTLLLALLAALGFIWVASPHSESTDENLRLILLGATALLVVAGLALTVRYEKKRWEVYF